MKIEEIFTNKIHEKKGIDYSYPYNAKRYFQVYDKEEDVTLEGWVSNEVFNFDIEDPRKKRIIIQMLLDKYQDIKNNLEVFAQNKEIISTDFKNDNNIIEDEIIFFWNCSNENQKVYFAITLDYIFGVNKNEDIWKKDFNNVIDLNDFLIKNYDIDLLKFRSKISTIESLISEIQKLSCKILETKEHLFIQQDIHFREEYLGILYNMLLCDKLIFADEINVLYSISRSLNIKNKDFLRIINSYYPFDKNKTIRLVEKNKKSLFRGNNRFIFINDLIKIIYSDKVKASSEEYLMKQIAINLDIEYTLIEKIYEFFEVQICKDADMIKIKEGELIEYLIKNNYSDEIKNILI